MYAMCNRPRRHAETERLRKRKHRNVRPIGRQPHRPQSVPTYRSPTASATIGLNGGCKSGRNKSGLRPETHQPDQLEIKQAPVDSVRNPVAVMQCPVCHISLSLTLIPISAVVTIPLLYKQNKRQSQRHARTPPRTVRKLKRTGHCTGQILLHCSVPKHSLHTHVGRS